MEPLRYRVTLRVIGPLFLLFLVMAMLADAGWILEWAKHRHVPAGLLVGGIVTSLLVPGSLVWLGNETVADERGISVRRRLGSRAFYPWHEIRSIDQDIKTGRVVVRTKEHGRVWLPAPLAPAFRSEGRTGPIPNCVAELRTYGRANGWHG